MKYIFLTIVTQLSFQFAMADRIGNGGGIWICSSPSRPIVTGTLVDLFELRNEFQLQTIFAPLQEPMLIYQERKTKLAQIFPEFAEKMKPYYQMVENNMVLVDASLVMIDDSLYITTPLAFSCPGGNWVYTQFANFTKTGRVLIRRDLWEAPEIPSLDKAALLIHEAVYAYLRAETQETDSRRARQITGVLFSTLSSSEMVSRLVSILQLPSTNPPNQSIPEDQWYCAKQNSYTYIWYMTSGMTEYETKFEARKMCLDATSSNRECEGEAYCAPVVDHNEKIKCISKNNWSKEIYLDEGKNRLISEVKALWKCHAGTNSKSECKIESCSN